MSNQISEYSIQSESDVLVLGQNIVKHLNGVNVFLCLFVIFVPLEMFIYHICFHRLICFWPNNQLDGQNPNHVHSTCTFRSYFGICYLLQGVVCRGLRLNQKKTPFSSHLTYQTMQNDLIWLRLDIWKICMYCLYF